VADSLLLDKEYLHKYAKQAETGADTSRFGLFSYVFAPTWAKQNRLQAFGLQAIFTN
jgi:hypothetical protein